MSGEDYIKAQAVRIAYEDGGSNGLNGMLAVLFVLRNKVWGYAGDAPAGAGDWQLIIDEALIGRTTNSLTLPDVRDPSFQKVLQYVDGVFDNSLADHLTDGAMWYGTKENTRLLANSFQRVAQVGSLTFWR